MKNFAFHRRFVCRQLFPAFASQLVVVPALRSRLTLRLACLERCQFAQLPVRLPQVRDRRKKAFLADRFKGIPFKTRINFVFISSIYTIYVYFYIKIYYLLKLFFSYFYAKFRKKKLYFILIRRTRSVNIVEKNRELFFDCHIYLLLLANTFSNVINIGNKFY